VNILFSLIWRIRISLPCLSFHSSPSLSLFSQFQELACFRATKSSLLLSCLSLVCIHSYLGQKGKYVSRRHQLHKLKRAQQQLTQLLFVLYFCSHTNLEYFSVSFFFFFCYKNGDLEQIPSLIY